MDYNSNYTGQEVQALLDSIKDKVNKVLGKQLSTEDFTTALKEKLESLKNYDDSALVLKINTIQETIDTLFSKDASSAIESFNEIVAFLEGIEDSESLDNIIASIETQLADKANTKDVPVALDILKSVYPVGAIYISTVSTSPTTLFGFGTWERIKDTFLLGAGSNYSAGDVGGESSHTLTIEEMPSHVHKISSTLMWADKTGDVQPGTKTYYQRSGNQTTQSVGDNKPHNNMPPYLAVYMWKRTE